ncbi:MAG: asparagine synthase (glutamine-hydrolyzing) [Nitrososphaerota archaeon]|jgi:asparagine synthase (glutamine-hydrolysing)|nr:asparagine synthase (glutamine-hydrolyzing) [Nitrososphaerota archaeon]
MCGINGFNFSDKTLAYAMNKAIKHRGPDDEGVFVDPEITFGHVRLAVLDLSSAGKQPMTYNYAGKSAVIVFNGEIYNCVELRTKLEKMGYKFDSKTDTEVILASYLAFGFDCVKDFNGMWAFVIYDPVKKIFFCSRDRLGVKPFYYFLDKDTFIFSSELKGILSHHKLLLNNVENINLDSLNLYFSLGYVPSPFTIFNKIFKLEPRQNLVFDLCSKSVNKWYYYNVPKYEPEYDHTKLIEEGRNLLKNAVELRMVADVSIGAFLSGGLDSTTTVGIMNQFTDIKNLHTFSIGFEGKYDETHYINIAKECFGSRHHHEFFDQNDFENLFKEYAEIFDEPFSDYSAFPTFTLCKLARSYVTVALSGDGGDEIFGGYPEHINGYRLSLILKIPRPLRILLSKIPAKKNLDSYFSLYLLKNAFRVSLTKYSEFFSNALDDDLQIPSFYKKWASDRLDDCFKTGAKNFGEILRLYDLMFNTLPDNYLAKVDKTSMAYALEVRSPFLDYRFINFSQRIPTEWKIDTFKSKKFMKELTEGIVPKEILHRRKKGFIPPVQDWINKDCYNPFLEKTNEILNTFDNELANFFKEKVLKNKNKLYGRYKIRLFMFGLWYDRWVYKPAEK